jgi:phosphatidylserine/phosphatidylglycerophosphate/cardiolipin synthase-like enzyme
VRVLVHGSAYFARLVEEVRALRTGDHLFFTDWRGDADERLCPEGPTVGELFRDAARRGVVLKGLMWRSHADELSYSKEENRQLGEEVHAAGGEVLFDERVRRAGSHHQKLVVLRHPDDPGRDVAFAGGIDLYRSRRDDATHRGDPQPAPLAAVYGERPPWHDVQLEIRGPAVGLLDAGFRERWEDPHSVDVHNPIAWVRDRLTKTDMRADPLPERRPDPPAMGDAAVQVLRTYPAIRLGYPFAPRGERSVARGFAKVLQRARRLVYLEDQHMWSPHIARLLAEALHRSPQLHLLVVVPRHPDVDGRFVLPPNQVGRLQAIEVCERAAPDRVHVDDVENREGTPVYVHAKVAVVDDTWACAGSANLNRRSWTHAVFDPPRRLRRPTIPRELSVAVLDETRDDREPRDPGVLGDGARRFARELRLTLMREHLDRRPGDDADLLDPHDAVRVVETTVDALDDWHDKRPDRVTPTRPATPPPARTDAQAHPAVGRAGVPTRLRPGRPPVARPPPSPLVNRRQRRLLAAFGATSREPTQPSLTVMLEVCESPAVGAASAISLGSTCPGRPVFGVSTQITPLSASGPIASINASTRSPSPSRHHMRTRSTTSSASSSSSSSPALSSTASRTASSTSSSQPSSWTTMPGSTPSLPAMSDVRPASSAATTPVPLCLVTCPVPTPARRAPGSSVAESEHDHCPARNHSLRERAPRGTIGDDDNA